MANASARSEPQSAHGPLRVLLVGAGSLGRAFLRRLRDRGGAIDLVGVVTGHHGLRVAPDGLPAAEALSLLETGSLDEAPTLDLADLLERSGAQALVECIPQNIRSGEPALSYHRTALDRGVHVVTANKSPIVLGYRDLVQRATKNGVQVRFETTVLDGMRIFSWVQRLGMGDVVRARGVLNGTSSVVLETVANGSSRSRGLARAQAQGVAEADSVLDLDGWDAAAKVALLANVWMSGNLRVVDVARQGCEALKDDHIRAAAEEGRKFRLVGEVTKGGEGAIRASVEPVALAPDDPLYSLKGPAGGLTVETSEGHAVTVLQKSYGLEDSSYGLVQDCLSVIARDPQI